MRLSEFEANELIVKIHSKLDYQEWDSDTPVEIAELLDAYGLTVNEPRPERTLWTGADTTYLAEQLHDGKVRVAVWFKRDSDRLVGVQVINYDRPHDDGWSYNFFLDFQHRPSRADDLDAALDWAIEVYEGLQR